MRREENLDITFASGNRRTDPDPPRPDRGDSKTVLPTVMILPNPVGKTVLESPLSGRGGSGSVRRFPEAKVTSYQDFSSRLIAKLFPSSQNGSVHKTHIFFFLKPNAGIEHASSCLPHQRCYQLSFCATRYIRLTFCSLTAD